MFAVLCPKKAIVVGNALRGVPHDNDRWRNGTEAIPYVDDDCEYPEYLRRADLGPPPTSSSPWRRKMVFLPQGGTLFPSEVSEKVYFVSPQLVRFSRTFLSGAG